MIQVEQGFDINFQHCTGCERYACIHVGRVLAILCFKAAKQHTTLFLELLTD